MVKYGEAERERTGKAQTFSKTGCLLPERDNMKQHETTTSMSMALNLNFGSVSWLTTCGGERTGQMRR
jgi:hypothetical protein